MRVIFLDVDGVLNSNQTQQQQATEVADQNQGLGPEQLNPEAVARLEQLVQSTGAKIVISSSWRHIFTLGQIKKMLAQRGAPQAARSVIDRTPVGEGNRGMEIQEWLAIHAERVVVGGDGVQSFVILDDTNDMTPEQQPRLVHTNPQYGLTDDDVAEAVSILRMGR